MKTRIPRETKVRHINLSRRTAPCPKCGTVGKRHSNRTRRLREIGISAPSILVIIYSSHYCPKCDKHFTLPMEHLAAPRARFTNRVRKTAVDLVIRESMTLDKAMTRMRHKYLVHVPPTTIHDWVVEEMKID